MLGRILRISSLLVVALSAVLAIWLIQLGVPAWIAVATGVVLPFAIHAVPLAIEFVIGALIDRRPMARLGASDAVRVWWVETCRAFVAFTIDQPWRANFAARTLVRDATRPAVLLVHGYMCNHAVWRPWLLGKLPHHWNVATVDLEPVYAAVEEYAHVIDRAVQQLREAAGAERVTLVAHSMGGLAARAYLRAHEHSCVQRVVTIDTPHHGTVFARYAHGANSRQMRRACDFVQQLAQREEPVEFVCFASQHDNLIVPRDSQVLDCAEAVWFEKIGHLAMTADDRVLAKLIQVVERPHADAVAAQPLAAA